jgi:hypothetical protein
MQQPTAAPARERSPAPIAATETGPAGSRIVDQSRAKVAVRGRDDGEATGSGHYHSHRR